MTELASEREGCSVVSASSNDLVHSPNGILNTDPTFWISTGIFPQEIVIQLGASSSIKSVDLMSMGIRKIQLDKCDGPQANSWEIVSAQEANDSDGDLQRLSLQRTFVEYTRYLREFLLVISVSRLSLGGLTMWQFITYRSSAALLINRRVKVFANSYQDERRSA